MSSLRDILVFLGPPGSGKGTLSQVCIKKNGWEQLSTGDLCRKHIAEGTPVGKEIDFAIKSGKLVSDGLISQMVNLWLASGDHKSSVAILDGYPRTVAQAESLNTMLKTKHPKISLKVILFDISDERVIDRLSNRYICEQKDCQAIYSLAKGSTRAPKKDMICDVCGSALIRRKDDNPESVAERLKVYHKHERALLNFFEHIGQEIVKIKADQSLEHVYEDCMDDLEVESA